MAIEHGLSIPPQIGYPIRLAVTVCVLLLFSRRYIRLRPSYPLASVVLGVAVFAAWIGPDLLFGYRHHWLFSNSLMGSVGNAVSFDVRNPFFLLLRAAGSALLVPIVEELFWRGWLMRWLIDHDFQRVPLGTYIPSAFWITAALFASEHASYWEVGLLAGVAYNWWVIRTKNLADCMLAHAVTNAVLAVYVIAAQAWQYWL